MDHPPREVLLAVGGPLSVLWTSAFANCWRVVTGWENSWPNSSAFNPRPLPSFWSACASVGARSAATPARCLPTASSSAQRGCGPLLRGILQVSNSQQHMAPRPKIEKARGHLHQGCGTPLSNGLPDLHQQHRSRGIPTAPLTTWIGLQVQATIHDKQRVVWYRARACCQACLCRVGWPGPGTSVVVVLNTVVHEKSMSTLRSINCAAPRERSRYRVTRE